MSEYQVKTRKKVLVIEDDAQSRTIFLDCLEAEGFDTICAENGYIGIKKAQEHLPDVVLCDIMMPGLDGYGVLTALRQNSTTATIPFIFLTAKATKAELREGMELGADDYLTKPSTVEELLGAIAARIEKQAVLERCYTLEAQRVSALPSTETAKPATSQSLFPFSPKLEKVFQYIETYYDQSISLDDVARAVGYSPAYLTDLVRRQTGQTVHRWIVERRMAAAHTLLLETDQSVNQIAEAVGYQNPGHFFRQFRRTHGTTPQAWRQAKRKLLSA